MDRGREQLKYIRTTRLFSRAPSLKDCVWKLGPPFSVGCPISRHAVVEPPLACFYFVPRLIYVVLVPPASPPDAVRVCQR